MRVERCLDDEKKNNVIEEDPCGQGTDGMRGGQQRSENRHFVTRVQWRGNFNTRSHVPTGSRMSHGGSF